MPSSRWLSKRRANASPSEFAPLIAPLAKPALERAGGGFDLAPHQEDVARVRSRLAPELVGWRSSLAIRWASPATARARPNSPSAAYASASQARMFARMGSTSAGRFRVRPAPS